MSEKYSMFDYFEEVELTETDNIPVSEYKPQNSIVYYPVHQRPDGVVGVGFGCVSEQDAFDCLDDRENGLDNTDAGQWLKTVTTIFEKIE